jgi:hypothetical protein
MSLVDAINPFLVYIETNNRVMLCKFNGKGEANVSEADHGDFVWCHLEEGVIFWGEGFQGSSVSGFQSSRVSGFQGGD